MSIKFKPILQIYCGILYMDKKKRIIKEIIRLVYSIIGGIILTFTLYRILHVGITLENIVLGVIVVLIAIYVVRITLWVVKESM